MATIQPLYSALNTHDTYQQLLLLGMRFIPAARKKVETELGKARLEIEGKLVPRATVRSGFKMNLADSEEGTPDGAARGYSLGASFGVTAAVLVDAFGSTGGDRAGRGWGVSARFVY